MDIYLLRTSQAEEPNAQEGQRWLSLVGRQQVRAIGTKLRQLEPNLELDRIVVAPSPIAMQTAELFAERLDFLGAPEVLPSLALGVPPQVATQALLSRGSFVVVVADEPSLSALGAFLCGRPSFPITVHAQVSKIVDRRPDFYMRPETLMPAPLLLA